MDEASTPVQPALTPTLEQVRVPDTFVADVANAVCDYCADGMDAFESCVDQATLEADTLSCVKQGIDRLYKELTQSTASAMTLFEQLCSTTVLQIPAHALRPVELAPHQAHPSSASTGDAEELQQQLDSSRAELQQVYRECAALQQEAQQLDLEAAAHGDMATYQALAATAASARDSTCANIAAIAAAAQRLAPMLERAAKLRTGPMGASHQGGARVQAGASDPAEWRVAQQSKAVGSLQNLQLLNSMLRAG